MNDLELWGRRPAALVPSREERAHQKAMQGIVHEAQESAMKVDAEAAVTARIMERAADLDAHRLALAKNNPTLDAVLTRIEVNFAIKAEQHQRNFGSRFGL